MISVSLGHKAHYLILYVVSCFHRATQIESNAELGFQFQDIINFIYKIFLFDF